MKDYTFYWPSVAPASDASLFVPSLQISFGLLQFLDPQVAEANFERI
jgi:hypothetical protein